MSNEQKLREALQKVREDINWMLNTQKFLMPSVFDYLDEALALPTTQERKPLKSVCHMECDTCIDAGECAHSARANMATEPIDMALSILNKITVLTKNMRAPNPQALIENFEAMQHYLNLAKGGK